MAQSAKRKDLGTTPTANDNLGAIARRIAGNTKNAMEDHTALFKKATRVEAAPRSQPLILLMEPTRAWRAWRTATAIKANTVPDLTTMMTTRTKALKSKYALDVLVAGVGTRSTTALAQDPAAASSAIPVTRTRMTTPTGRMTLSKGLFGSFPRNAGSTPHTLSTMICTSATAALSAKKLNSGAKAFASPTLGSTAATQKQAPSPL